MDSDLAEAVQSLKGIFEKRRMTAKFGKADPAVVEGLRKELRVPSRYRAFLLGADPVDVETFTPTERVRFISADKLAEEQRHHLDNLPASHQASWRKSWIVIARSSLLGDPYFLDISKLDAEGDCPVFCSMTGTAMKAVLCGSTLEQFLRILAVSMEVAAGFGNADLDVEDEATFRESLAPKVKTIDAAAMRAGHWT